MAAIFAFTCSCCGKVHEGSPSFAFKAPDHYACLTEEQKAEFGRINSDLCIIKNEDQTDYFIRAVLEVPIHGVDEPFIWGIWVSLSEKSFRRYVETYEEPVEGDGFFGWVCNKIPWYPPAEALAADVEVQLNGQRPLVRLHHGSTNDYELVADQMHGISVAKAQQIAEFLRHRT